MPRGARAPGVVSVVACLVAALPGLAQRAPRADTSAADVAIRLGQFDVAEAELFAAVRRAPREPSARGALGAFLAARGRLLVGATLLEEALMFGADTAAVEARLFDIYLWAGRYGQAAALRTPPIAADWREALRRAGTLQVVQAGGAAGAAVPLHPNEALGLGRITIGLAEQRVEADIQAASDGLWLPATAALFASVEPVGARGDTTFAVIRSVTVGDVTLGPVPVRLLPTLRAGRIGLDILAHLRPTFDAPGGMLIARPGDAERVRGRTLPLLLTFPGVSVVARAGARPVGLHTAAGRAAVRGARWSLEVDRGAIVLAP